MSDLAVVLERTKGTVTCRCALSGRLSFPPRHYKRVSFQTTELAGNSLQTTGLAERQLGLLLLLIVHSQLRTPILNRLVWSFVDLCAY